MCWIYGDCVPNGSANGKFLLSHMADINRLELPVIVFLVSHCSSIFFFVPLYYYLFAYPHSFFSLLFFFAPNLQPIFLKAVKRYAHTCCCCSYASFRSVIVFIHWSWNNSSPGKKKIGIGLTISNAEIALLLFLPHLPPTHGQCCPPSPL